MTIRARLRFVLGALSAVIVAMAVAGWMGLTVNESALTTVYEDRVLPLRQLKAVSENYAARIMGSAAKLREGLISWEEAGSGIAQARGEIERQWRAYLATYLTEEEKALVSRAERMKAHADSTADRLESIVAARDQAALARLAQGELYRAIEPLVDALGRIADLQTDVAASEFARTRTVFAVSQMVFVALALIGFAAIAAGGWIVTHRIARPLGRVGEAMRQLAAGDTSIPAAVARPPDEIAEMFKAIEVFRQSRLEAERVDAEKRKNDEWLRRMLDELPIGVSLFDDDERVFYRNAEMHRLVPVRDPDKAIGMSLEDLAREAIAAAGISDPAKTEEIVAAALARYRGAKEGRFESDIRADRIYGARFRWISGRLVVAMVDITPLRSAQIASAQSELRLKLAVQALPVSFSLLSADRRLVLMNDQFLREFPEFADEIRIGMSHLDFIDAQLRRSDAALPGTTAADIARARTDAGFRRELVTRMEAFYFDRPDASRDQTIAGRTYRMRRTRLPNGEVVRISLDITDLKAKETEIEILGQKALARRTSLLREVLDAVPDAIAILDQELKLRFANRALAEASGFRAAEMSGLGLLGLLQRLSIDPGRVADLLVDGAGAREIEIASERDNRPLKLSVSPVATGEVLFAIVDLSEQRRRESERLEQQKRLAHADKSQALVTLAGSIAHDFNNLLGVIDGFATMAHEDATELAAAQDSPLADGIVSALDRVLRGSERARQIVKSLNTLGRQRELPTEEIDLREPVGDAGQLLRVLVPSSAKLVYQTPDIPCRTISNSVQIEQVVTNLVINGVHAMEDRAGTVTVRLELIDIDGGRAEGLRSTGAAEKRTGFYVESSGDGSASLFSGVLEPASYVRLTVADQGSGMSEETLRKILNPFFTTKGPSKGTGLGLSSVVEIVTAHRGGLHIRTRPGVGTEVMILFPEATKAVVRTSPNVTKPTATEPVDPGAGADVRTESRILVVDDEQMLVDLAIRVLGKLGHEAEGYVDARAALDRLVREPYGFDLIITDHTMPDITGSEMVARIAAIRPDLPVIMVTGSSSVLQAPEQLPPSVRRLIAKPYKPNILETAVREALADL